MKCRSTTATIAGVVLGCGTAALVATVGEGVMISTCCGLRLLVNGTTMAATLACGPTTGVLVNVTGERVIDSISISLKYGTLVMAAVSGSAAGMVGGVLVETGVEVVNLAREKIEQAVNAYTIIHITENKYTIVEHNDTVEIA